MRNDPTAEKVRDHLLSGVRHGEKLPTERALAEQFGVSRNVIRRALLAMEVEGRIVRKVGNGTYFVESTGTPAAADDTAVGAAAEAAATPLLSAAVAARVTSSTTARSSTRSSWVTAGRVR